MFCQDHCQLCCTNCVLLNHRQCKEVTLISETVQGQVPDLLLLVDEIETTLRELKDVQSKRGASSHAVEGSYNQRLQEIMDVRQKLNAALDELEKRTIKELTEIRSSLQVSLKTDVEVCNRLHDELKQLTEALQNLGNRSNIELSFIAGRKCMDKKNESKAYLKEISHKVELSIVFLANTDIEQYVFKQSGLGRIVRTPNPLAVQRNPNHVFTVKTKNEYDIRIPSDSCAQSYVRAICVISYNKIIIVDNDAKRVKLLDQQYNVISHCDVPVYEGGMCPISESEVAVTVTDAGDTKHAIQFITESNGQLVVGRKFQVQHKCKSIAHHKGDLFITSYTALYKYTLDGQLINKLYVGKSVYMCAVSPTGDRIYLTTSSDKLLTLSTDGTLISSFTVPEENNTWGVHVTPSGQVLVCGFSSRTVIQVDEEGKIMLATLATQKDFVSKPTSVCYDINTDSVIVGQHAHNKILVLH